MGSRVSIRKGGRGREAYNCCISLARSLKEIANKIATSCQRQKLLLWRQCCHFRLEQSRMCECVRGVCVSVCVCVLSAVGYSYANAMAEGSQSQSQSSAMFGNQNISLNCWAKANKAKQQQQQQHNQRAAGSGNMGGGEHSQQQSSRQNRRRQRLLAATTIWLQRPHHRKNKILNKFLQNFTNVTRTGEWARERERIQQAKK